jgi:uncharacterized protein (DUF58 family)
MSESNESANTNHAAYYPSAGLSAQQALKLLFPNLSLLSELERMSIHSGNRIKGMLAGKRRSSSLGGSQEFADYRPYTPGDDIRRIDWNVYGRTGKAFMRQYWDEQELQVSLYIDVSESMAFGNSGSNKLQYALRLAACLGYIALCGDDRISVRLFRDRIIKELQPLHGRVSSPKLFQFLSGAMQQLESEIDADPVAMANFENMATPFQTAGALPRRSGSAWVLTDAMFEQGVEETLVSLIAAGQQVVLVHILSPDELNPDLSGELKLIDSELGTGKEVAIGHKLLQQYRGAVASFQSELKRICAERGASYVFVNTGIPLEETVRRTLFSSR